MSLRFFSEKSTPMRFFHAFIQISGLFWIFKLWQMSKILPHPWIIKLFSRFFGILHLEYERFWNQYLLTKFDGKNVFSSHFLIEVIIQEPMIARLSLFYNFFCTCLLYRHEQPAFGLWLVFFRFYSKTDR